MIKNKKIKNERRDQDVINQPRIIEVTACPTEKFVENRKRTCVWHSKVSRKEFRPECCWS